MTVYSNRPPIPAGYSLDVCSGSFSIIEPYSEANLVENPSFETGDTTGYNYFGLSNRIEAVTEVQLRGSWGCLLASYFGAPVIPPTAPSGMYTEVGATSGATYTGSVYVKTVGYTLNNGASDYQPMAPTNAALYWATTAAPATAISAAITVRASRFWRRYTVTFTAPATTTYRLVLRLGTDIAVGDARALATDCWQIEENTVATTYLDGSLISTANNGYAWGGAANETFSLRTAFERSGGVERPLSFYGLAIERMTGLGMAPRQTIVEDYALLAGSTYQRSRTTAREFTLVGRLLDSWASWFHQNRRDLIQALTPDRVLPYQPVVLTYQETELDGTPIGPHLSIPCIYISGLEGDIAARTGEGLALTFRMPDPYLFGEDNAIADDADTTLNAGYLLRRRSDTGGWGNLTGGSNGAIADIQFFDGAYVSGNFTSIGTPAITTARVARWNGTAWEGVGNSLDANVATMARSPSGVLTVGGTFANSGAPAAVKYLATLSGSTWAAVDNAEMAFVNASGIRRIAYDRDGGLLVAATWTGGMGAGELGFYSTGGVWSQIATAAQTNGIIRDIAYSPDGRTPYVVGSFTTIGDGGGAVTVNYAARYFNGAWEAFGTGLNGAAYRCAFDKQGRFVVVGAFTTADGETARGIARWNGTAWEEVANGFDMTGGKIATALEISDTGAIYVAGDFVQDGDGESQLPDGTAFLAGGRWQPIDVDLGTPGLVTALGVSGVANLWLGLSSVVAPATVANTIVADVQGTAPTAPMVSFTNDSGSSQRIYAVNNWTTRQFLLMQTDILDGETITVTCGITPSIVSDTRINIGSVLLPATGLAEFVLQPGENNITTLAPSCTTIITWTERYDGIEGAV